MTAKLLLVAWYVDVLAVACGRFLHVKLGFGRCCLKLVALINIKTQF